MRMPYPRFRAQGPLISTKAVAEACRRMVGKRLKRFAKS